MKVLYLCSAHPPYDKRVYYKISKALAKCGNEVINVNPNTDKEISKDNITIDGFTRKNGMFNRILGLRRLFKKGKEYKPDLIIAPEPDSIVIAFLLKLFNKNIKVIFDCHEWYEIHFKETVKNKFISNILNHVVAFVLKFISKRIDAVFCVNETMKNKYLKYNPNSYSIINTQLIDENKGLNKVYKEQNSFAFLGNFADKRQENILIDAAIKLRSENSNAKIRILGGFSNDGNYLEKYKNYKLLIEKKNLEKNIEIIPWVNKEEVNKFLEGNIAGITRFDSYLYGEYHCLPNKIFDYMAANLAVITCRLNKETSKIVEENDCGVTVYEESGEALAEGILYLMKNKERTVQMGRNAYETILHKYNWSLYEKEVCKILNKL